MKNLVSLIIFFCPFILFSQLTVTSTFPESQSLTASINEPIIISFSEPISPFTISGLNFQVFGRWSGPMQYEDVIFTIDSQTVTFIPSGEFIAGEMVTVSLSSNVSTPNNDFLEHGFSFSYWVKTEPGNLELTLIQEIEMKLEGEVYIQCYGAYAGDLNDDGYSDLAVINENVDDVRVLLNDGTGMYNDFTIYEMPLGYKPSPNEGADFNHDGFIDLAVSHVQSNIVSVLMGDGNGGFLPEVGYTVDQGVRGLAIIDIEADGHADIVTANRVSSTISLMSNNGLGVFDTITSMAGMSDNETAVAIADANEDGVMDLFIGSFNGGEVYILLNDGEGNFSEGGIVSIIGQVWMITIGDLNNDGHVDLVSANSTGNNCSVHFGDGMGGFTEMFTYPTGNFPLAIDLGDLDGDGDLDMITSNFFGANYTLFENDGSGLFINPITYEANDAGSCAIFHDRNNDGVLDLTLVDESDDVVFIYENQSTNEISELSEINVSIRPNPFKEEVLISIYGTINKDLTIYNMEGKQVAILKPMVGIGTTNYHWKSLHDIPAGMYSYDIDGVVMDGGWLMKIQD